MREYRAYGLKIDNQPWRLPPMEEQETIPKECAECQQALELGVDAITLSYGVVGPRGIVPLHDTKVFCSENCLHAFVCDEEVEQLPRRVP